MFLRLSGAGSPSGRHSRSPTVLHPEVDDPTALPSPIELPPSVPIEQRLDGPTFGTEAASPRTAISAATSTTPWWLFVSVAALAAGGVVLFARRRRSRERSPQT